MAKNNGLQTPLNLLQGGVLANQAGLLTQQNNLSDGDLTTSKTNGLQSALDLKEALVIHIQKQV